MRKLYLIIGLLALFQLACSQKCEISSPNDIIQVSVQLKHGEPYYQVFRFGKEIIKPSRLGFILKNEPPLMRNFKISSIDSSLMNETWNQTWGEKREIRNLCKELKIHLKESSSPSRILTLVFRVFDDGVGFRYEIPQQPNLKKFEILDELTEFALTDDHKSWWIPAYKWNRYEYLYQQSPISAIDTVHTPITLETTNGLYLSFHEAALTDYASMTLVRKNNYTLKCDLVPWSDGVKVKTETPMKTPWRSIQIADTPGGLITSYLILNLNEPNKLNDASWIKPGKYVGIWWEMHFGVSTWASGSKHGTTTKNAKR